MDFAQKLDRRQHQSPEFTGWLPLENKCFFKCEVLMAHIYRKVGLLELTKIIITGIQNEEWRNTSDCLAYSSTRSISREEEPSISPPWRKKRSTPSRGRYSLLWSYVRSHHLQWIWKRSKGFLCGRLFTTKLCVRLLDESLKMLVVLRAQLLHKYQSECTNE